MPVACLPSIASNPAPSGREIGAFVGSWERGLHTGGAERPGVLPLPCQYSNNSTEPGFKLTPYQRKNAYSINENLGLLVELYGLEKIGFLTLTFPKNLTLKEANARLNSLATHVLGKHFVHWVCVREFTRGGRPHLHLIVVAREDIRAGFDFESYLRMNYLGSRPERRRKFSGEIRQLARSLNPSPPLAALWKELRRVLPLYQFGRHELIPIRKSGQALARYVGGYIRKSMEFRPESAKGARLITYSKGFPRKVVGHAWSFHCESSELWRAKVAVFAKIHRVKDLAGMQKRFGPRWAWWFKDLISSLNLIPSLSFAPSQEAAADAIVRYVNGPENAAFKLAMDSGTNMLALHLRRPELPDIDGKPASPPRRLRAVFDYHLSTWDMTPCQISARSASDQRRAAYFLTPGVVHTHEALARAREKLLAVPAESSSSVRAKNFARLVHPSYYSTHYQNS